MVAHFFYVDLVFGLFVACAIYLLFTGGAVAARRLLTSRKMLRLGLFSYSIYLLHGPILAVLNKYLIGPLGIPALAKFGLLLVVGVAAGAGALLTDSICSSKRPSSGIAACALSEKSQACR